MEYQSHLYSSHSSRNHSQVLKELVLYEEIIKYSFLSSFLLISASSHINYQHPFPQGPECYLGN